MNELRLKRAQVQELTDRLIAEYAATLPPGQVLAAVVRAQRQLPRTASLWSPELTAQCEVLARQHLSRRLAPALTPAS